MAKKVTRSIYITEEASTRLNDLADADYNAPSRYLEKLIDQAWSARMGESPAVGRRARGASRPRAGKGNA